MSDPRWQCQPALPDSDRARLVTAALKLQQWIPDKHGRQRELDALARSYGVTLRTLYRYLQKAA